MDRTDPNAFAALFNATRNQQGQQQQQQQQLNLQQAHQQGINNNPGLLGQPGILGQGGAGGLWPQPNFFETAQQWGAFGGGGALPAQYAQAQQLPQVQGIPQMQHYQIVLPTMFGGGHPGAWSPYMYPTQAQQAQFTPLYPTPFSGWPTGPPTTPNHHQQQQPSGSSAMGGGGGGGGHSNQLRPLMGIHFNPYRLTETAPGTPPPAFNSSVAHDSPLTPPPSFKSATRIPRIRNTPPPAFSSAVSAPAAAPGVVPTPNTAGTAAPQQSTSITRASIFRRPLSPVVAVGDLTRTSTPSSLRLGATAADDALFSELKPISIPSSPETPKSVGAKSTTTGPVSKAQNDLSSSSDGDSESESNLQQALATEAAKGFNRYRGGPGRFVAVPVDQLPKPSLLLATTSSQVPGEQTIVDLETVWKPEFLRNQQFPTASESRRGARRGSRERDVSKAEALAKRVEKSVPKKVHNMKKKTSWRKNEQGGFDRIRPQDRGDESEYSESYKIPEGPRDTSSRCARTSRRKKRSESFAEERASDEESGIGKGARSRRTVEESELDERDSNEGSDATRGTRRGSLKTCPATPESSCSSEDKSMKPLADEAKQLRAKIAVEREELIQLRARVNAEKGKLQEGIQAWEDFKKSCEAEMEQRLHGSRQNLETEMEQRLQSLGAEMEKRLLESKEEMAGWYREAASNFEQIHHDIIDKVTQTLESANRENTDVQSKLLDLFNPSHSRKK